jgi:hypothetical protein
MEKHLHLVIFFTQLSTYPPAYPPSLPFLRERRIGSRFLSLPDLRRQAVPSPDKRVRWVRWRCAPRFRVRYWVVPPAAGAIAEAERSVGTRHGCCAAAAMREFSVLVRRAMRELMLLLPKQSTQGSPSSLHAGRGGHGLRPCPLWPHKVARATTIAVDV